MADPTYLSPFVLSTEERTAERHGAVDLYLPEAGEPRPAVVVVHGGPVPADVRPTPRDWPIFRGYPSALAARGVVGATVDHRLHGVADYPLAADDIAAAVDLVRADPRVDPDRIALWFFSGGGLLLADWLRTPPDWLRIAAATYPMLSVPPEYGPRFNPAAAVGEAGTLPILLTRVGRENPQIAATVAEFVTAAEACGARLEIIDVPNGQHSFDILDHTDESRDAVERALTTVLAALK
ncbi:MAG: hypothetical protein QOD41_5080 [Cryptosporangiaceae bacterium]|jgi:acetyl esterase/lipase|nr:hypothetical protein [Cryptosporangiaceae bacterium]